jgi:hypothetical protein
VDHRDPAGALASWCSLTAVLGSAASDQVNLEALVADLLGEVERLYTRMGLELSGAARQRMSRWIQRHHHRGRGRPHRYSLADFGLDPALVDRTTVELWRP